MAALVDHVDIETVCPEVEIGLGVPRDPLRVVGAPGAERLVQPDTGRDLTDEMTAYAAGRLAALGPVDGFILKSRSPSCGLKDTKVYPSAERSPASHRTAGFFAREVARLFPEAPVEDEGRLTNFRIREHFLAAVFTLASLRALREQAFGDARGAASDTGRPPLPPRRAAGLLTRFHAANKLLLMSHSQAGMRQLGGTAANLQGTPIARVYEEYARGLSRALARPPRPSNTVNVLTHAMGYFKDGLTGPEKRLFLEMLESYREGRTPLGALLAVLGEWIARFDEPYLAAQTFFAPYPDTLVSIRDSGLGR